MQQRKWWFVAAPVTVVALTLTSARTDAQRAPSANAEQSAPQRRVVDEVRASFTSARGWFRLVEDGRFEQDGRGRLTPDYRSLSHPRVRRSDNAGYSIVPTFAQRFTDPMRVAVVDQTGVFVDVSPLGAERATARIEDGLVVYPDAWESTDVLYKSTPTHVDEYLLLRSPRAPSTWRYRIAVGPQLQGLRQTTGAVEVIDARGAARLRANRPFAVDADGKRVYGTILVEGGSTLSLSIDLRGLRYPVLVDPDWRPTADMAFGRFYHGAHVLPDGQVLVTGGCSASVCSGDLTIPACRTIVASAETLDLRTRTWSRAGDDPVERFFHGSESLSDGAVLVAGGCTDPACATVSANAQVYDPAARAFRAVGALSEARAGFASVRLRDGRVLLAGGCTATGCSTRVELFDPVARTFSRAADLATARGRATATLLSDGTVLVAGGCTTIACAGVLASAERFDPLANRWHSTAPMSVARGGHFAVALLDGRVIVGGGCPDGLCATILDTTERFDPASDRFEPGPRMGTVRVGARAVRIASGEVMVSQGCQSRTGCDLTNELLDARGTAFARMESALTIRAFHETIVHEPARMVIAIGGCQPRTCSWWNETYDYAHLLPIGSDAGPSTDASIDAGDAGAAQDAAEFDARADGTSAHLDASAVDARDGATLVEPPARPGCACRTSAPSSGRGAAALALAMALALSLRARRRGRLARGVGAIALLAGCSPPSATDAGTDAGTDASTDAGTDASVDSTTIRDTSVTDSPVAQDAASPCESLTFRSIGIGWNHSLAITEAGSLRAWGANGSGQLGVGDNEPRARATRVEGGASWRTVAGGSRHSCGIREDGTLWCWGVNVHGQLGVGDIADRTAPTQVGTETDWVEVACGGLHSCGVRAGGSLWCWGANPAGQLGLGAEVGDRRTPQRVGVDLAWRGLAAKARFNCALREDDGLWCWGDNSDGQLGLGDTADRRAPARVGADRRWSQVRMGPLHTCAIDALGALYCWGLNDFGQLGTGDRLNVRAPVRVGADSDWALVTGGFEHSCGIKRDGSLWCWGNDAVQQLGLETDAPRDAPARVAIERVIDVVAGQGQTCALGASHAVWCWGDNTSGQAGSGETRATRVVPGALCATR